MANPAPVPFVAPSLQIVNVINLTPTAVNGSSASVQVFTQNGLDPIQHQFIQVGQLAYASGAQTQTANIIVEKAWVSNANELSILFRNLAGGSLTPAAGYYSIIAL